MYTAIHLGSRMSSGVFSSKTLSPCETIDKGPKSKDLSIFHGTRPCGHKAVGGASTSTNGRSLTSWQGSHCSLWWFLYSNIGYYTFALPYKFVLNGPGGADGHYRVHASKVHYVMYCIMAALAIISICWRILIIGTCTSGFDHTFHLIDHFSDMAKFTSLVYVWGTRKYRILRVMNQRLPDLAEEVPVTSFTPGRLLDVNSFLAWVTLSFYSGYVLLSKLVGDIYPSHASVTASYAILRKILDSDCGSIFCFGSLRLQNLADVWVIATAGFYCKMANDMRRKLQNVMSSPTSTFHQESVFIFIRQFQDQIANVNSVVQEALLVCLITDLPYYVLRAIPSILFAQSFTFVMFRRVLYVMGLFTSLLMTGIVNEQVQGTIRLWISKTAPGGDLSINSYQSLLWDLDSNRDLTLSLGGFAYINTRLFISMLSITLTYTIIYYQFHSTGTVAKA